MCKLRVYKAKVTTSCVASYTDDAGDPATWRGKEITGSIGTSGLLTLSITPSRRRFIRWVPDKPQSEASHSVPPAEAVSIGVIEAAAELSPNTERAEVEVITSPLSVRAGKVMQDFYDAGIHIDGPTSQTLALSLIRMETGRNITVWLRGPSGYGKTTIPQTFAKLYEKTLVFINCATITDPEEWFGIRGIRNQETVFEEKSLVSALEGGDSVILFDEINRAQTWVLNALFSILDDTGEIEVGGRTIKVGKGISFFMTSNEGGQFVGTSELDVALTNRVEIGIIVNELPAEVEIAIANKFAIVQDAVRTVQTIRAIRRSVEAAGIPIDVSTRVLIKVCKQLADGMGLQEACINTIANTCTLDFRRQVYDIIIGVKTRD